MKKFFILLITIPAIIACSQQGKYDLSGNLSGIDTGTILLEQRTGNDVVAVDSTEIRQGRFQFEGSIGIPDLYYLRIVEKRGRLSFFLENSEVTVSGHADSLYLASVSGSSVQDELEVLNDQLDQVYEQMRIIYGDYRAASEQGDEETTASLEAELNLLNDRVTHIQEEFVAENPASYISPYVVQNMSYELDVDEIEGLLLGLDERLAGSQILTDLWARVEKLKSVAIGQLAPEFSQADREGNQLALSSLLGNYLLIDFWAAWCGPCRRENPNIVAAYEKYHDKGFDILGVSLDETRENWLAAIEEDGLTWHHVSDLKGWRNEAAQLYAVNSIPSSVLLDREGKIIARNLRGEDLHDKLAELLD